MHDPLTVAHEIKYPWWKHRPWPKHILDKAHRCGWAPKSIWGKMNEKERRGCSPHWPDGYRESFITIWHRDPEIGGSDDSCGFCVPHLTRQQQERLKSLAWNEARYPYFLRQSGKVWAGTQTEAETMRRGLILVISDYLGIKMTFDEAARRASVEINMPDCSPIANGFCHEPGYHTNFKEDTQEGREERALAMFCGIARWILKDRRPWYRHPRWHVWHWRLQVHPWQWFRRGMFDRCEVCGKGFRFGACVISTCWERPEPRGFDRFAFWRTTTHIRCDACGGGSVAKAAVPDTIKEPARE